MTQYPGYEVERFENEGGGTCYYFKYVSPKSPKMEVANDNDQIQSRLPESSRKASSRNERED